jgi:hypothetical protein
LSYQYSRDALCLDVGPVASRSHRSLRGSIISTEQIARQGVELRIHGVNNASPASMLESDPRDVVRVGNGADDAAGFFRRRVSAGSVEPGTVREATDGVSCPASPAADLPCRC